MSFIGSRKSLINNSLGWLQDRRVGRHLAGSVFMATLLLTGCQLSQSSNLASGSPNVATNQPGSASGSPPAPNNPYYNEPIAGYVTSGGQPLSGATVQIYQAGTTGDGSQATALLTAPATTDATGYFSISGAYSCNFASLVYVVATGGNPGLAAGTDNSQASLMAALTRCGDLQKFNQIVINELTTVASVAALAPYMQSYDEMGAGATDYEAMDNAFNTARTFVDMAEGTAPGKGIPAGQIPPTLPLDTLGNIVAGCVNSSGGSAGDSSPCGQLFTSAQANLNTRPTDTIGALIQIEQNPTHSVTSIFNLYLGFGPYLPVLTVAPSTWAMAITSTIPTPIFSPTPGTYSVLPTITLADSNPLAVIHYTTNGKATSASPVYTGPITLPNTSTINAVAIVAGLSSLYATGVYALPVPTVGLSPSSVSLTVSQTEQFTASVGNTSNTAVTWSLSPAAGSISSSGFYTAPSSIASAQSVTVTATSVADTSVSASATVSLVPPVSVSVTPTSVILNPSQTQTFTATVANTSNTTVTWSVSPTVGNISSAGIYTAPAAMSTFETVTVTAKSVADSTKTASASVSLLPSSVAVTQAQQADSFVGSVGLNVHFSYNGTIYTTQSSQMVANIETLGVRHLRDQMSWQGTGSSPFYTVHNTLASAGVKTDYILTSITYPISQVAAYPALVKDMEAAEASNEYDAAGVSNWVQAITTQQTSLYNQIHGSSATSSMTVISPSLAQPQDGTALGSMTAISDAGNSHAYFGGYNPGNSGTGGANNPPYFIHWADVNTPTKPLWVTETGFYSEPGAFYAGYGISEAAQAIYTPRVLLEFWKAGAARSYIYELADYSSSDYWGLIRSDGTAKPAFGTLAIFLSLLGDPGPSFTPGTLDYGITGGNSQVQQVLFQKRDGSFYLAIWVEALSYNFTTSQPITVPSQQVSLQVGGKVLSASTSQLDDAGNITTTSLPANQTIQLNISDKVQVVKLVVQ